MTDINSIVFFIQLVVVMGLFFYKFYNLLSVGRVYSLRIAFITLIAFFLAWGIGFAVSILNYDDLIYSLLMQFETWFMVLFVALFIAELIIYLAKGSQDSIKAYSSLNVSLGNKRF